MATTKIRFRSKCEHCGEEVRLGNDLALVQHQAKRETYRGRRGIRGQHCAGSGESRALEVLDDVRRAALRQRFFVDDLTAALEAQRAEERDKATLAEEVAKKVAKLGIDVPAVPDGAEIARQREKHAKDYPTILVRVPGRKPATEPSK